MFNRFLNKRKSLTVQTSLLIILVITVALVISTMLFYYKAAMELTVHYRDQMFQESNITMNALSDNIDSIDSIYRLLISNDTIYGFMTSSSKKPSDYIAAEKQMTSILILNNIWEKNYLRSVYVYTNNKKKFYVSKEDNIITTEENAAVYRNLTEPSPTLTLHTLDTSNDLYFVRKIPFFQFEICQPYHLMTKVTSNDPSGSTENLRVSDCQITRTSTDIKHFCIRRDVAHLYGKLAPALVKVKT